jgi:hypothetical protein
MKGLQKVMRFLFSTTVTTLSTDLTSEIVITLGGREVKTQYLEPTTKVRNFEI